MNSVDPAYSKMIAYGTILLLLWALSKTGVGYRTLYYATWLIILILLIRNAAQVTGILQPLINPNGGTAQ